MKNIGFLLCGPLAERCTQCGTIDRTPFFTPSYFIKERVSSGEMHFIKKLNWKHLVFLIYCFFLSIAVYKHEPWFDEAQAWLLARDSSPIDLFTRYMRYEGSPGLWHALLLVPAKLGLPYIFLNITAALIAASGVYLFIFYSPFPTIIKVLYPFSFFSFYQYAVVARSYVLLPLLLFLIASLYPRRLERPFLYIILLCLLANVSLHGFIISISLAFLYFIDILRSWSIQDMRQRTYSVVALTVFAEVSLLLVWQLKPAPDLISFAAFSKDFSAFYPRTISMLSDSLITGAAGTSENFPLRLLSRGLIAGSLVLSLYWFILKKKLLVFVIPVAGLGALFTVIYANIWHQGSLFLTWLFVMWLSFQEQGEVSRHRRDIGVAMTAVIVTILGFQVFWSIDSLNYDYAYNYSASKDVADFIKNNSLENKKIYMTGFHAISILPYFDRNIFCNYHNRNQPSFWIWSSANNIYREPYLNLEKYQPDFIVMGVKNHTTQQVSLDSSMLPEVQGYRLVKCFDGNIFWKNRPYETDSFALYEKASEFTQFRLNDESLLE